MSETLLLTLSFSLCLLLLAAVLTLTLIWVKAMTKLLLGVRDLYLQLVQLLASKDIVSYDAIRRTTLSETDHDTNAPAYYYTGDAYQYESEKMEGRVSDDELTGVSNFGI